MIDHTHEIEADGRTWPQVMADAGGPVPISTDPEVWSQLLRYGVIGWDAEGALEMRWDELPTEPDANMDDLGRMLLELDAYEGNRLGGEFVGMVSRCCRALAAEGYSRADMDYLVPCSPAEITRAFGPPEMDAAVAMVRDGASLREVGRMFGASHHTVDKWAAAWGVRAVQRTDPTVRAWLAEHIHEAGSVLLHRRMAEELGDDVRLPSVSWVEVQRKKWLQAQSTGAAA